MTSSPKPTLPISGQRLEGVEDWQIRDVRVEAHGHLVMEVERADKKASANLTLTPPGATEEALVNTRFGDVAYGTYSGLEEGEVASLAKEFAACLEEGMLDLPHIFPHLLIPSTGLHDAPERRRLLSAVLAGRPLLGSDVQPTEEALPMTQEVSDLFFDPPGLAEFLEPELAVDGPPVLGFVLRSISIPPIARREAPDFRTFVLAFEPEDGEEEYQIVVGDRGALSQPFGVSGEMAVGLRHFGRGKADALPPPAARLCSWILSVITLKQSQEFTLSFPADASAARSLSVPSSPRTTTDIGPEESTPTISTPPPALNLTLDAECGQSCAFCSLKTFLPPSDGEDEELEFIRLQLETARSKGVNAVRLNGIDPLAFSRLSQVLDHIKEMGFESLTVYSPAKQLADPKFRSDFLSRTPADFKVVVPIYGLDAETHDAITGSEGAFTLAMAAIEGMKKDAGADHTAVSTVVLKQNLQTFTQMVAWAKEENLEFQAHLPYPMKQSVRDNYADVATPEKEVLQTFLSTMDKLPADLHADASAWLGEVLSHPCILWNAQLKEKHPFLRERVLSASTLMDGTDYRSDRYVHGSDAQTESSAFAATTIPCPHRDDCALTPVCSGEHYALYDQLFGLDEFKAVTVLDIYTAMGDADFRAQRQNEGLIEALKNMTGNTVESLDRLEREIKRQYQQLRQPENQVPESEHRRRFLKAEKLHEGSRVFGRKILQAHKDLRESLGKLTTLGMDLTWAKQVAGQFLAKRVDDKFTRDLVRPYRRKIGGESLRHAHQILDHMNDVQRALALDTNMTILETQPPDFDAGSVEVELKKRLSSISQSIPRTSIGAMMSLVTACVLFALGMLTRDEAGWMVLGFSALVTGLVLFSRLFARINRQLPEALTTTFQEHWHDVEAHLHGEWERVCAYWAPELIATSTTQAEKAADDKGIPEAITLEIQAMRALVKDKAPSPEEEPP